uniref:Uncharacterized protein n=1 Tax=Anguilla anguilla TaxID=7936 RepID=A0A0E9T0V3_ANGAN
MLMHSAKEKKWFNEEISVCVSAIDDRTYLGFSLKKKKKGKHL